MKKTLSILLIELLFLNLVGFNLIFGYMLYSSKSEGLSSVKNIDDLSEAILIVLTKVNRSDFQMIDSKEIKYKGRMYDIYKRIEKNKKVYFYCKSDEHEDEVLRVIDSFQKLKDSNKDNKANPFAEYVFNNLIKNFIQPYQLENLTPQTKISYCIKNDISNNLCDSEILLPPPKQAFS